MKKLIVLAVLVAAGVFAWPKVKDKFVSNPEQERMEQLLRACDEQDENRAVGLFAQNKLNPAVNPRFDPVNEWSRFLGKLKIYQKGWKLVSCEKLENGSNCVIEREGTKAKLFVPNTDDPMQLM